MKNIIAKFQCHGVMPAAEGYPTTARLNAVYANSDGSINEENQSFSEATPSGHIEISISPNAPAHKFFRNNRYYYVRFERIPMTEQEIEWERIAQLSPEDAKAYHQKKHDEQQKGE